MNRRVVVTGLGWVTPLGVDLEGVFASLVAGRSGLRAPSPERGPTPPVAALGEVSRADHDLLCAEDPEAAAGGDPRTLYAAAAARRALADAGLAPTQPARAASRGGVSLASGPGVLRAEDAARGLSAEGRFDPARFHATLGAHATDSTLRHGAGEPAALVAQRAGARGPVFAPLTACAGGAQALGLALRALRSGEADWMLAGGADARLASLGLVWFVLLGAAASAEGQPAEACKPFDRRRSGVVVAEGAAMVVLETEEHARARGARIRAEFVGYGASLDAYRATAPSPDGRGRAQAMACALRDGGLVAEDIDLVNAHGTGTRRNDPVEVAALKTVFGAHARRLVVPGLKSMLGHLLAASAAAAFVSTVLSLERDLVPPTATLREPDPLCDLDHVAGVARHCPVRGALVNAFAFGGINATLALRKWTGGAR